MRSTSFAVIGLSLARGAPVFAQSPEWMAEDCSNSAQSFFQDFEAETEMKYEGTRSDGTHAMNGKIYLKNRSDDIQCSYDAAGTTMVDFLADDKNWPDFAKGGKSPYMD